PVVQDESAGVTASDPNPQDDVAGADSAWGPTTVADLFAAITDKGDDTDQPVKDNGAIGFARGGVGAGVEINVSYGADEAGAVPLNYALGIPGGAAANGTVDSGLTTTDGHKIYLFLEN